MARSREFLENYFNEITADSERQRRFMLLIRRVDKVYLLLFLFIALYTQKR